MSYTSIRNSLVPPLCLCPVDCTVSVPFVSDPHASGQVGRKPHPSQVRQHAESSHTVNLAIPPSQRTDTSKQGNDVDHGGHGFPQPKEKRHPGKIEDQADSIESLGTGRELARGQGEGTQADIGDAVSCIAHQSIESGPYRTKEPGGRIEGRLAKSGVRLLGVGNFADRVTHERTDSNRKEDGNGRRREGAERKREAVEGGWPGHAGG